MILSDWGREISSTKMIRPATIHDVPKISDIINSHAELGKMLFKSYAQLFESLRDFAVYEEDGEILGCAALSANVTLQNREKPANIDLSTLSRFINTRLGGEESPNDDL